MELLLLLHHLVSNLDHLITQFHLVLEDILQAEDDDGGGTFNPSFAGLGGNLTVANFVFVEGHVGSVGEGTGFRGFAGVTLERLMKNSLNLPFNLLVGSEAFYSTDMAGVGNSSGWAALGVRLDVWFLVLSIN